MAAVRPGPRISRSSAAEDHDVTTAPLHALPAAKRRRLIIIGLLRASAVTAALVVAYYLLPLDHLAGVPLGVSLAAGLVALAAMAAYQVRAIIRARYPGIRAIEARNHRAAVPASVRGHLCPDGSGRSQQLQRVPAHSH